MEVDRSEAVLAVKAKLSGGLIWAFFGRALSAFSAVAVSIFVVRLLTPGEVGAYFLVVSVASAVALIAQLGLDQAVIRLIAEPLAAGKPSRVRGVVRAVVLVGACGAGLTAFCLWFGVGAWLALAVFESSGIAAVTGLLSVWVVVAAFQNLVSEMLRGFGDIRFATLSGRASSTFIAASLLGAMWAGSHAADLGNVTLLMIIACGASLGFGGALLWRRTRAMSGGSERVRLGEILCVTWPNFVSGTMGMIQVYGALWILGAFGSDLEVALYGAAYQLVVLVEMPLLIVNAVIPSTIVTLYTQERIDSLEAVLRGTASLATMVAAICTLVLALFGAAVLSRLYGDFYRDGYVILLVMSLARFVAVATGSCGIALVMTGRQHAYMRISVVTGLAVIGLSVVAVESFGAAGVAMASAIGVIGQNLAMLSSVRRNQGFWTCAKWPSAAMLRTLAE